MIDINKKIEEFNKRFDIIDNQNYADKIEAFVIRIVNLFESKYTGKVSNMDILNSRLCTILGISSTEYSDKYLYNLPRIFQNYIDEKDLYKRVQALIWASYEFEDFYLQLYRKSFLKMMLRDLSEIIQLSQLNISIGTR